MVEIINKEISDEELAHMLRSMTPLQIANYLGVKVSRVREEEKLLLEKGFDIPKRTSKNKKKFPSIRKKPFYRVLYEKIIEEYYENAS